MLGSFSVRAVAGAKTTTPPNCTSSSTAPQGCVFLRSHQQQHLQLSTLQLRLLQRPTCTDYKPSHSHLNTNTTQDRRVYDDYRKPQNYRLVTHPLLGPLPPNPVALSYVDDARSSRSTDHDLHHFSFAISLGTSSHNRLLTDSFTRPLRGGRRRYRSSPAVSAIHPYSHSAYVKEWPWGGLWLTLFPERNGRKTLTTVQGIPIKFDQKKILKVIKKKFGMLAHSVIDFFVAD